MEEKIEGVFCRGDLVFAKVPWYPPWPGQVEGVADKSSKEVKYNILFFGKFERATCKESDIFHFEVNKEKYGKSRRRGFRESFEQIEEAAREHASHMASSRELPEETPTNIMKKEKCSEIPIEGNSLPIPGSETAVLGDISVNQPNFILKEEPIESEETWREDIKSELTSPSANNTKREESDEMHWQDIKLKVSINQTNIVVKEEPAGIEVKDEPVSSLSSSISCEEPVKNETLHGDIVETRICHLKKEKESEEGDESPVDPLPEAGVSGMKVELEINSFVSFRSDAPGQLFLDTKSGSYIAETQRPVMTQMDSTREFNGGTSCLETAPSSSQSPSAEATGMSTQEHSSVLLQNLHSQTPLVMAACFTATDRYLLERQDKEHKAGARQRQEEEQMAGEKQRHEEVLAVGERQKTLDNQSGSERGVSAEVTLLEWEKQKCASVSSSNEKSVRKSKGKAFECSVCKKYFPSKVLHTVGNAYMCSLCEKSFSHKHPDTLHTGEKPYNCSQCQKSFSQRDHLKIHMRLHTGEKPFHCSLCKKSFSQRGHLDRHMSLHTEEKPFQCSLCKKSFTHKQKLTLHMRLHLGEKPYNCSQCQRSFSRRDRLKIHMRLHTGEKPFHCSLCKKSFSQRGHLDRHMSLHTGEKPFQCSRCEKSFSQKGNLDSHMRLHTGEKPFQCSMCEKSFPQRSSLARHMPLHTGEKSYKCSLCKKSFTQRSTLTRHMRLHTGEKPYNCSRCEKSFRERGNCDSHMRLHTGEKPYNCSLCVKSFARGDVLTKHMRLHTGEKPYNCSQCEKFFSRKDHLKLHMRLHTREKPFQCSLCEKSFRDRNSLTSHMCIQK